MTDGNAHGMYAMRFCRRSDLCAIGVQIAAIACLVVVAVVLLGASHRLTSREMVVGLNAIGICAGLAVALTIDRWRRRYAGRAERRAAAARRAEGKDH